MFALASKLDDQGFIFVIIIQGVVELVFDMMLVLLQFVVIFVNVVVFRSEFMDFNLNMLVL